MIKKCVSRATAYLCHILRALEFLDVRTVFRLFVLRTSSPAPLTSRPLGFPGCFYYRGFSDRGVMSHFYKEGYHIEPEESRPVKWIFDLGANIGDETVKFAIRHKNAKILALEPANANYDLLVRNSKPFFGQIIALNVGAWYRDASLEIHDGSTLEAFTVQESPTGSISARSLQSLMAEYEVDQIDILKIDIEGAEFDLFKNGAIEWLPLVRSIVVELSDVERSGTFQNFFHALEVAGFQARCYICGENIVAIREGAGLSFQVRTGLV